MAVLSNNTPVQVKDRIDLTDVEKKIFDTLLNVVNHFNLGTELRVAGGWVRDKLLGKDCYDIDIALDNMKGEQFCEMVNEYFLHAGERMQRVGVIQSNPDQSKHLETATMRIFDMSIDFVNLRSEAYVENSRIPMMKFGTAEEDAYRRDLTINSLFYNINTDLVEDLTGRGMADLKAGMIATPLPPKATFLDDPLRVLRAIRFGARFGFMLHNDLKRAAADEEVKAAFVAKISRERVGHEVDLMISGNQPVKAMAYICELQLFWFVFSLPLNLEPAKAESCDRFCVAYMDAAWNVLQQIGSSTFNDLKCRLYLYGALFLPLRKFTYIDGEAKKKTDAQIPVVNKIFKNSLKLKSSDAEMVKSLHNAVERFVSLIVFLESSEGSKDELKLEEEYMDLSLYSRRRIYAGKLLRQIKDFWRVALLLSTLLYPNPDEVESFMEGRFESKQRGDLFRRIEKSIIELDLENVWLVKPLIDGKAIINVLGLNTGGPLVRDWQQKLTTWQLAHPSSTAEDCLDWMRQSHAKRAKLEQ